MHGKLAIVTGASQGLGLTIADHLAEGGIGLLLVARDKSRLADVAAALADKYPTVPIEALAADLADEHRIASIAKTAAALGGADILINCAAIQGPIGRAWEIEPQDFMRTIYLDLCVPALLCRVLVPQMIAKRRGWIVNVAGGGATKPRPMFSAYAAAKTALVRFTETLAIEAAAHDICCNCISPGAFRSRMTEEVLRAGNSAGSAEAAAARSLAESEAAERKARAAQLVRYLVAGDGRNITGKLISAVWDEWPSLHRRELMGDEMTLRRLAGAGGEDQAMHISDAVRVPISEAAAAS